MNSLAPLIPLSLDHCSKDPAPPAFAGRVKVGPSFKFWVRAHAKLGVLLNDMGEIAESERQKALSVKIYSECK